MLRVATARHNQPGERVQYCVGQAFAVDLKTKTRAPRILPLKKVLVLVVATLGALLLHGYHPWAEDAEIYVPGILKLLNPQLFPFNAGFFQAHAHLTIFPDLMAASVRISHLPLDVVLFIWQLASIFLLLWASWDLLTLCFPNSNGRWAGVALIGALLTLPVAGTALYILDQYSNPRNLAAFAMVFAIARVLAQKYWQAGAWVAFAGVVHPLMGAFTFGYCVLFVITRYIETAGLWKAASAASTVMVPIAVLPFGINFAKPSQTYHQVALLHSFHYLVKWKWYEMLGVVGPLLLIWWFGRVARARGWDNLQRLCRVLIIFQVIFIPPALILCLPRFESLARLQPMRSVYLLYVLFVIIAGGFLGEFVLQKHRWRWLALFVPLCSGMCFAQFSLFPNSQHVEWPGSMPKNEWEQAFFWIRANTPADSIFALDPHHMNIEGEDNQGFRGLAQRSMLADETKDSGAVSMFPPMADEWMRQVKSEQGWEHFRVQDFERLQDQYGVSWVIIQQPGVASLTCPYRNSAVLVCHLN